MHKLLDIAKPAEVRDVLAAEYDLKLAGNTIVSPGKFEGEYWQTLYFYDAMVNGDRPDLELANECMFKLGDIDRKMLGYEHCFAFWMNESDSGFVTGSPVTKRDYEAFERAIEESTEEQS